VVKKKKKEIQSEPDVLTGLQEAELLDYVNWSDGDAGLKSCMSQIVRRLEIGTYIQGNVHDPTDAIIGKLDRIHRHRVIHRAMGSIGKHEKTLRNAYTIAPKPACISQYFGHWYSGVALSKRTGVAKLVEACHRVSMDGMDKCPSDWKHIQKELTKAMLSFHSACRAYSAALKLAREPLVVPTEWEPPVGAPHTCRISRVYCCPCGG